MWYLYTMEYYVAIKSSEICSLGQHEWILREYQAKWNKPDVKGQELYGFPHTWDIKRKATDKLIENKQHYGGYQRGMGWEKEEDKGVQICGDRNRLDSGWWAHSAIYRCCIKELYTWNWHNVINQCYPI